MPTPRITPVKSFPYGMSFLIASAQQALAAAKQAQESNIVGVGIGVGLKEGRIDLARPLCLRFFVRRKIHGKNALAKQKFLIDPEITLGFDTLLGKSRTADLRGRSLKGAKLALPTDVTEVAKLVGCAGE